MPTSITPTAISNPTVVTSQPARDLMTHAQKTLDEGTQQTQFQQQKILVQQNIEAERQQQESQRRQDFELKSQMEHLKASLSNG